MRAGIFKTTEAATGNQKRRSVFGNAQLGALFIVAVLMVALATAKPAAADPTITESVTGPTSIGNGMQQLDGTYINAQNIANNLAFNSVTVHSQTSITIVDPIDLSSSPSGTPQYDLSLVAPVCNIDNNINMAALGNLNLTCGTIYLNGKITSGESLISSARIVGTATQVSVLSNSADIQQAIDASSPVSTPMISVSAGKYADNLVINHPLTISGNNGNNPTGADANAPTITGTQPGGNVATVSANGVEINGLHLNGLVNGGSSTASVDGILANNVDGLTIAHNTFDDFSGVSIATPGSTNVVSETNNTVVDPADVTLGNGPQQLNGTFLNCQKIADNLVFTSITVQATVEITVADPCDLSTSANGTPQFNLSLVTPTVNVNNNLNMAAAGLLILTDNTINLNAKFTSGAGRLINPSRVVSTATQVNVLSNNASIQQAIDSLSVTANNDTVLVSPGQYTESIVINMPMTLSGDDSGNPTGAGPNAPTINGTEFGDPIIDVVQNNVEIDGLHLNGVVSGSPYPASNGISFVGDQNVTAAHNTFDETSFSGPGVNTANSFNLTLNANDFSLPAPGFLTAAAQTNQSPVMFWTPTTGGDVTYDVYRNGIEIGTTLSDVWTDTTAPVGSNTYYVVADSGITPAGNNTTVSPQSNIVTVVYDTTAPSITYTLSPAANGNGWNNAPVNVTFNCSTTVTGVTVASCTSPVTLSSDGANQTVKGIVTDSAGNTASVTATVNLEQAAPSLGAAAWSANPVADGSSATLTVPVSDNLSGVIGGEYFIGTDPGAGNGTPMNYAAGKLTASIGSSLDPGAYTVSFRAQNAAGNWSDVGTTSLVVSPAIAAAPTDLSAPTPTDAVPALSWTASSGATSYNVYSGGQFLANTTNTVYTDSTATPGTLSYYVTAANAGGESVPSNTVAVVFDTTAPTITYSISPKPNGNGWNDSPVTVTFNCSDATVQIASCTSPVTVTTEGAGELVKGTAVNNAGDTTSVTTSVYVDVTAPWIGSAPNWNPAPITTGESTTLTVPATDGLSGVMGGEYYLGSTDPGQGNGTAMAYVGGGLRATLSSLAQGTYTVNMRAEDNAGNWSTVTTATLVVNNPVPAAPTGLSAPSPTNQTPSMSWTASANAASYNVYRNGSLAGSSTTTSFTDNTATPGTYNYAVTAVDPSGESGVSNVATVIYDTTAPTISYSTAPLPNGAGWFSAPVTVTFICTPAAGLSITNCSAPASITTSGAGQQLSATATDNAGNTSSQTFSFNVDLAAPTLGSATWSVNPVATSTSSTLTVPVTTSASPISAAEYFIGTDPGQGHGTAMAIGSGKVSASISESLPATYVVNVRVLNAAGTWSAVSTTNLVVNAPIASAPTHLAATSPTNQAPALSWTAASGATSYNVYRGGIKIGNSGTASFTDNSAPQGTSSYFVTAVNSGGESAPSNTISVQFDSTPPTITYTLMPVPNSAGWENSPVTVAFTCTAAAAPISSCSSPVTVSTDGANVPVTGTAVDTAGNTASVTASVNLDQTLPTVGAPALSTNPITVGQSSTLTAAATDNLSGVVGGEYFIGTTDPGVGHGTSMSLSGGNLSAAIGSSLSAGTYQVNVRDEDTAGNWSAPATINIVVNPLAVLPAITSSVSNTTATGAVYSFTVTTTGSPTPTVTESGALPHGITFTANSNGTATLAGTAAAGTAGNYPLVFTATNSAGHVTQSFTLTVTSTTSAPKITSGSSVTAAYGMLMTPFAVTTTGNPAPALTATGLPSGLKLTDNGNGTGSITGTPNKNVFGPYSVTITAKNSIGSVTQSFTLTVTKAPSFTSIGDDRLAAVLGSSYSLTLTATGYPAPVLTESGALPSGLKFTANSNGTATISGTPAAGTTGNYTIKVTATNTFGTTSETFKLSVIQAPSITSSSSASAKVGTAFKFQLASTGFPAADYFILGSLPKGVSYNVETGVISGTPAAGSAGVYKVVIFAYNSAGITSQKFTLTVQ